jgi:hypothetical protein
LFVIRQSRYRTHTSAPCKPSVHQRANSLMLENLFAYSCASGSSSSQASSHKNQRRPAVIGTPVKLLSNLVNQRHQDDRLQNITAVVAATSMDRICALLCQEHTLRKLTVRLFSPRVEIRHGEIGCYVFFCHANNGAGCPTLDTLMAGAGSPTLDYLAILCLASWCLSDSGLQNRHFCQACFFVVVG